MAAAAGEFPEGNRVGSGRVIDRSPARVVAERELQRKERKMPAKSQDQQKAAGAALAAKRGKRKVSELKGASKDMYETMSETELEKMASGSRKGKPEKV